MTVDDLPLIERLAKIPYTGAFADILFERGLTNQVLPPTIQAVHRGNVVAGRALTVEGRPTLSTDPELLFIPFLEMLGAISPGDVIVSQPNDSTVAHLGELSSETALQRGGRGAIIDGGVRDLDYIEKLGFPVFARYRTPTDLNGRWRLVSYNQPITIGGTAINPGDYVVGDSDGVVVIPREVAEEVCSEAERVVEAENLVRRDILAGEHPVAAYRKHGRF